MQNRLEALALEYGLNKTPRVTAKGHDDLARRIIEEAKKQGVYVAEDPQLLALLSRFDISLLFCLSYTVQAPSKTSLYCV